MTEENYLVDPDPNTLDFKLQDLNNFYMFEFKRLETFSSWQVNCPVDAARLAKSGFYYSGIEDEVICFSCKGHIKNWNFGDIVQKKHSELFPNCDFVNNCSNNIPISQSKKIIECPKLATIPTLHQSVISGPEVQILDLNQMKSVEERLKSFADWPFPNIVVKNLALAGFYYQGCEDKVQCPFCKGVVENWKANDDPFEEHASRFPQCCYVLDILPNFNPKFNFEKEVCNEYSKNLPNEIINDSETSLTSGFSHQHEAHSLQKLGILFHNTPTSPHQASFSSRLQTFASWPVSSPVSKESLAKAGFFYIGLKDHTKCFYCDGGLCNWVIGDDPWVEHAKWFSKCGFLQLSKGALFIQNCNTDVPSNTTQMLSDTFMLKVEEAMKSTLVKNVLESTPFPSYIVRAAVVRQLKETGSVFSTKQDLCLAVTSLKNEIEMKPIQMSLNSSRWQKEIPSLECDTSLISDIGENLSTNAAEKISCDIAYRADENGIKLQNGLKELPCNDYTKQEIYASNDEASFTKDHCLCIICMEHKVSVVFLPCGHLLACAECATALKICAICRKPIQATVRAYLP